MAKSVRCQIIFEETHTCDYLDIAYSLLPAGAVAEADGTYFLNSDGKDLVTVASLNIPTKDTTADGKDQDSAESEAMDSPE